VRLFKLTRMQTYIAGASLIVAVIGILVGLSLSARGSKEPGPAGILVNVVPLDPIGGAPVFPTATGGTPSDYLSSGQTLRIDCLQLVKPRYLFAFISDGAYQDHWIDAFDVKTLAGQDVRFVKPPLPECGPPVTFTPPTAIP
jgi:hypothetical protein